MQPTDITCSRNVPAVAAALPTRFIILTSAEDAAYIREHPAFKRLAVACETELRLIDHLITDVNYSADNHAGIR